MAAVSNLSSGSAASGLQPREQPRLVAALAQDFRDQRMGRHYDRRGR